MDDPSCRACVRICHVVAKTLDLRTAPLRIQLRNRTVRH
jgi:hypothetical protein